MSEMNMDQAAETDEFLRNVALQHRKPVRAAKGTCYNCDEPTEGVFCDGDCREDYEKRSFLGL